MKIEMDRNGLLTIEAETPIEAFALDAMLSKLKKSEDLHNQVVIKTGIKQATNQ